MSARYGYSTARPFVKILGQRTIDRFLAFREMPAPYLREVQEDVLLGGSAHQQRPHETQRVGYRQSEVVRIIVIVYVQKCVVQEE
jgi:hypothetical protein